MNTIAPVPACLAIAHCALPFMMGFAPDHCLKSQYWRPSRMRYLFPGSRKSSFSGPKDPAPSVASRSLELVVNVNQISWVIKQ
jgi:hypothetical protein